MGRLFPFTITAASREVFDVPGAGDTVVAAALALCRASRLNAAAGVVVGKVHTATVDPEEVIAFL